MKTKMSISKYNLHKFIVASLNYLDDDIDDGQIGRNSKEWTIMVARIYKNNIPDNLLKYLIESSSVKYIIDFANIELAKNKIRQKKELDRIEQKEFEYKQWILRRDDGNIRALAMMKKQKDIQKDIQKEIQKEKRMVERMKNEKIEVEFMPIWQEQYIANEKKREQELKSFLTY